ncbi:MAG: sigma-70 family RNA polymerase sigma factor [Opitutales bacterium]|nr:sigma-70 family RNA polymerase sigma factor [Opitutales bacterium]
MEENTIPFEYSHKLTAIQRSLYAYILSLLPNRSDAEDILQETNLILCKKAKEYKADGHFQGWAFRIARYQIMAHMTKSRRSKIHFSNELVDAMAEEDFDSTNLNITQKALQICYDLLPKHMQLIARLRFKEEKTLRDISSLVNRPLGSVSATLHRIRQNLVNCVQQKTPGVEAEMDA